MPSEQHVVVWSALPGLPVLPAQRCFRLWHCPGVLLSKDGLWILCLDAHALFVKGGGGGSLRGSVL